MKTDIKIDFLRYALYELMLPHQLSNDELIWRCNRVVKKSQEILNQYGLPQNKPYEIKLLENEPYYLKEKDKEIDRLNKVIKRYETFFKVLRFFRITR